MFQSLAGRLRRPLGFVVSLIVSTGLAWPTASLAVSRMSVGGGGIDDGPGSEGDPLDSNDFGGGGGGTNYTEEDGSGASESGGSGSLVDALMKGHRILFVPEFRSGTVVFRIVIIESFSGWSED